MQLEPIAIIGIGCRFPGAKNPQAFWSMMRDGIDGVSEVPASRWDVDSYYDPDKTKPGKANTRWGGFLADIEQFDPHFFGIAPKEAITIDPQQRLLLEVAWETLEDAGQVPETLKGSKTGVFIGIGTHDYSIMMWQQPVSEPYATTGTGNCIAANRISYLFDFKGPSLAVDTACSSSLVSVHLACQSIWNGESELALAGGVNMLLLPTIMVGFSKGGFMSSDGRCKSFDDSADGYVRGEGAGLVLLKPLSQAKADGNDIYGVILSSAVNQDGLSNGMAAPNPEAQAAVLKAAYQRIELDPATVDYVEAHGTGTKVGDPIEAQALGTVLGKNRQPGKKCLIGSVKTNIGHTETAAGIAGIIKVALALKHQQIPPSLHFKTPNRAIAFEDLQLEVVTKLTPWRLEKPRLAGVNSFGFGGTNAHIVMGEYIASGLSGQVTIESREDRKLGLLTIAAKNKSALQELGQSYQDLLETTDRSLADICVASQIQRSHFNHRLSCIAKSRAQLTKQLNAFRLGQTALGIKTSIVHNQTKKICWLFTGQGSQYIGMGQQLYTTQLVFKQALDRCAKILENYWDTSLLEILYPRASENSSIDRTIYTQPAIFALEYALAQLWLAWGVKPDYVAGHSIGEYVAACIAGVFSLEDALKLVATRGRLMAELPLSGGMLAVFSSEAKIADLIATYQGKVNIAAINNQQNTVIAGNSDTLTLIEEKLAQIDIGSTRLKVSHAFHSALMKPMLEDFRGVAEEITYNTPKIPLVSNVTARLAASEIACPDYWLEHIVKPVQFADSFQCLLQQGVDIFLEVGAKPILASISKTILATVDYSPLVLPSLSDKQADWQVMLNTVAELYHQGVNLDWQAFDREASVRDVKLPTYPFQRQKYWWSQAKFWAVENRDLQSSSHPLLGNVIDLAVDSQVCFQGQITANSPEYLQDHRLQKQTVLPATAYIEIALAAGKYLHPNQDLSLENLQLKNPLLLTDKITKLQTVIEPKNNIVRIFSKGDRESDFVLHSEVKLQLNSNDCSFKKLDLKTIQAELKPVIDLSTYYQNLRQQGLNYGSTFQGIKQLWQDKDRALGYIQIADKITDSAYHLHPALLDSCLQLIGAATESSQGVYLPVGLESLNIYQSCGDRIWAQVELKPTDDWQLIADLFLVNDAGDLVAEISNFSLQYLSITSLNKLIGLSAENIENTDSFLYEIGWQAQDLEIAKIEQANNCDRWIVIAQANNLTKKLVNKLSAVLISPGEAFKAIDKQHYLLDCDRFEDWQKFWQQGDLDPKSTVRIVYLCDRQNERLYAPAKNIFNLIQSVAVEHINLNQLAIITQKNQFQPSQNLAAGIWGLGRTIQQEYPSLNCNLIDFDELNLTQLLPELLATDSETQVAYSHSKRYVPRLTPKDNTLNHPYRLHLSEYGTLDNLTLAPLTRNTPQAGEIEIEVAASGVNFRDVLNALGVLKEYLQAMGFADATKVPFGGECAGRVVAVGAGVDNFGIGDKVIAAQAVGSLSSHVTVDARFAIAKPDCLNYTEAATIPTTFLTAYYGLHHLAKIKPGDKILIHAAAGGVGQAAVQIAQQVGAEIYATASVGKWDFLKTQGIKHIMNSRTLDYAAEVMQITGGKGVDLILNSLNGKFIPRNLEILAPQGRFVEIGKVGIWDEAQILDQRNDISYFPFDLLQVSQQDPDLIARLLAQLEQQFVAQTLKPLPYKEFPIQKADDAFRYMAQAKQIGKVVISTPTSNQIVKSDGSYLITGGYGALGLQVANWLVEEGVTSLILLGKSQPNADARQKIDKLKQQGVTVKVIQADLCDLEAVTQIFASENTVSPTPIRGIVHAAGMLDNGLLKTLDWERFEAVLQPKITGTWNLHLATKEQPLDWFVCFSSIVSVFGAAGQSNYAAANAYMDNLMSYRRSLGLPGLSINWSIWDEVGMATRIDRHQQRRLERQGLNAIAPAQGLTILKQLLQQQANQTIVFPVDWATFFRQQPPNPFFARLQPQAPAKSVNASSFLQQLATTPEAKQLETLQAHIQLQIAKVLGYNEPEDIDTQDKFADLGMDSLMAVEFKNSLQASLGDAVSLTAAFDYPNVELLAVYIAQELAVGNVLAEVDRPGNKVQLNVPPNKIVPQTQPSSSPVKRSEINVKPEHSEFALTPEYLNLKKDLERVAKLGNPFFSLHQGIAQDTIQTGDRQLINYSSYNYIGMSGDPVVIEAAQKAIAQYGTSVSASRVLSGERPLHLELEREIADLIGTEDAIVYVGGHATNVSTIGHLFGKKDLIVCDALSHNSIREGCNLSGATIIDFPHNDCQALEEILARERTKYQKVLIAVEGIYSTDGDLAPLPEIVTLKQHYQTFLLVDEAHSIGVIGLSGGGIREHFNLQAQDVDLWMGTLSKSFASCGGYIAGSKELIQYLKYTAPGFVFSVGMSPGNTAAALAAIRLLKAEPERAIKLQSRAKFCLDLAKGKEFNTGYSGNSPVIPIIVGEPHKAVKLSQFMAQKGINVKPMVYPSVAFDAARLRLFITSLHTEAQIKLTIDAVAEGLSRES